MTKYATGNPVGSSDPRDLYDNAQNIDEFANSTSSTTHPDRRGVERKTLHGMEVEFDADQAQRVAEYETNRDQRISEFSSDQAQREVEFNAFIAASGYTDVGPYASGIEITAYNQTINTGGTTWRLSAGTSLPYTTTGAGMPEGGAFVDIGDALLRQEIGDGIVRANTVSGLAAVSGRFEGDAARITTTGRAGDFAWSTADLSVEVSGDPLQGVYVASTTDPTGASGAWVRVFTESVNPQWFGAVPDGVTDSLGAFDAALLSAKSVYIPEGDYYLSNTLNIPQKVHMYGSDTLEGADHTTLKFPVGVNGIEITDPAAQASRLEGFVVEADQVRAMGGAVIEYNPTTGEMLYSYGDTDRDSGRYEIRAARTLDTVRAVIDMDTSQEVKKSGLSITVSMHQVSGTFVDGEQLTGASSGTTANVFFISDKYVGLLADGATDVFEVGETITGGTSGATAKVLSSLGVLRVAKCPVTLVSGSIGALTDGTGYAQEVFTREGTFGHGIVATYRFYGEHLSSRHFSGDGILIATTDGYVGNANLCRISRSRVVNCGGNGIRIIGADANAGSFDDLNLIRNFGFAVCDRSFLGNTFDSGHSSDNFLGGVNCQQNANARNSLFLNMYSEGARTSHLPWPITRNTISGSTIWIGGTNGLPVVRERATNGESGGLYLDYNGSESVDDREVAGRRTIFPKGLDQPALSLASKSSSGADREAVIDFSLLSSGREGENYKTGAPTYAKLVAGENGFGQRYPYISHKVRQRNLMPTISGTSGTGAVLEVVTDGSGVVTSILVHCGGKDYSDDTTITVTGGTGGDFQPAIQNGVIQHVEIVSGGTGYNYQDYLEVCRSETSAAGLAHVPGADDAVSLGKAAARWSDIYAANGTISTSDEREKEQQRDISAAELRVAQSLKQKIKAFKWSSAVAEKGEQARWHFGVMAQEVVQSFEAEGLSASDYGMLCYDHWEATIDEDGNETAPAGDRYGVRYDQLLAFIVCAM